MAIFRRKDSARRRVRQDAHALAMTQAKTSFDFHGDRQLAYMTYMHLMESEAVAPLPYHLFNKELK